MNEGNQKMAAKKIGKKTPSVAPGKVAKKRAKKKKRKVVAALAESSPAEISVLSTTEMLSGVYCNIATIKHTPREFLMDFVLGIESHHSLVARVITNPAHAKEISEALAQNIAKYEKKFGEIKVGRPKRVRRSVH